MTELLLFVLKTLEQAIWLQKGTLHRDVDNEGTLHRDVDNEGTLKRDVDNEGGQ